MWLSPAKQGTSLASQVPRACFGVLFSPHEVAGTGVVRHKDVDGAIGPAHQDLPPRQCQNRGRNVRAGARAVALGSGARRAPGRRGPRD